MAADPVQPGFLSASAALEVNAAIASAAFTQERLRQMEAAREEWVAVKLTSCDTAATPARCAWTERAWQADGTRYDKPSGRSGTTAFRPALLIGNGVVPPAAFPVDVWARITVVADTLDQVLEVEWNCACAAGGSALGSAGGGTDVVTDCGTYSTVLVMTMTDPGSCPGAEAVIDLEWDGTVWTGTGTVMGQDVTATVDCAADVPFLDLVGTGAVVCTVSVHSENLGVGGTLLYGDLLFDPCCADFIPFIITEG